MTTHTYAGYTAEQIRAAAESGLWSQFINVARPATVLALLDRIAELEKQQLQMADDVAVIQRIHGEQKSALYGKIAELEQRVETVEGWHFTETSRADELQESIYGDRDEIAGLRVRIAELEADSSEYEAFVNECRAMSPGGDVPLHGLADRMRADKRALRIDAERYRWIRDKERFHVDGECGDAAFSSSMCCAEEFDDALDDAIDADRAEPAE